MGKIQAKGESNMVRMTLFWLLIVMTVGCGPTPQQEFDAALKTLNRQQERLDGLRPAYDAARQTATLAVCKELAGATPDESAAAALEQLESAMSQAAESQASAAKSGDIDATIDSLIAAQGSLQEQQAALSAPLAKSAEVMKNIKTPGTPEAKRLEEVFEAMPEVQAYRRQEKRVATAQKSFDAAEAALDAANG